MAVRVFVGSYLQSDIAKSTVPPAARSSLADTDKPTVVSSCMCVGSLRVDGVRHAAGVTTNHAFVATIVFFTRVFDDATTCMYLHPHGVRGAHR